MKQLILTLWFVLIFSTASWADTQTVTEEVCPLLTGCMVVVETGRCIGCVVEIRKVDHVHEVVQKPVAVIQKPVAVIQKPVVVIQKPVREEWRGGSEVRRVCIVEPCDWLVDTGGDPRREM